MTVKRKCFWAVVVLSAAAVAMFHAPLLRWAAVPLIADEPPGRFQYVGIFNFSNVPDGDRCFDVADALARENSCEILVIENGATRLVETGAQPSFESISRRELKSRGLPPDLIHVIRRDGYDDWSTARTLQAWLAKHPKHTIVLLCDRFRSAHLRHALNSILESDQTDRVRVRGLADRRYNETDWWQSRAGIRQFGVDWLRRLHDWCIGGEHRPAPYCDADDYERNIIVASPTSAACWLDVGRPPRKADDVMLLAGGENTRPFVAAALYKAGFASRILITRIADLPQNADSILPPYHEINRNVLIERGVPPGNITILPAAAASTYDEAQALAAFLKDKPQSRVLVVTDDFHTRRSRWVFDCLLGKQSDQVSFVSAPYIGFGQDRWWQDENAFVAVATEFPKLAFYVVYYGYVGYWLLACGCLLLTAFWIRHTRNHSYRSASIGSNRDAFQAG